MLSIAGRGPTSVFIEPIARRLLRMGLRPNQITITSAALSVIAAVVLIPTNHLFAAAVVTGLFTAFDLVDGTMARLRRGGTRFGATLDATCDRITDGALFTAVVWWLVFVSHAHAVVIIAAMAVVVLSQVISYVKARGEASGLSITGGLVERAERLIVMLVGLGLEGLGLHHSVDVAIGLLLIGSLYTVVQRLMLAYKDPKASERIAAPAGATIRNTSV